MARTAPTATFLHFATHGFFTPESEGGKALLRATDLAVFRWQGSAPLTACSPLALCGLALAGANRANADGEASLRAEQIAALDLTRCRVAVLSACQGSAGFLGNGHGVASLRAGLRAAGVRFVVSAPWKVDDPATRALMEDFYAELFAGDAERADPPRALWVARQRARERGANWFDWAGWTVSGT